MPTLSSKNNKQQEAHYVDIYNHFVELNESLLGPGETVDADLRKLGLHYFGYKFAGVFSSNTIPFATNFRYCIANLDPTNKPGSHWIAIAKEKGRLLFYDSFGRETTDILPDVHNRHQDVDHDAEQDIDEANCGQRCLAWLMMYDQFGSDIAKLI
jgi:hypothetical protein